MLYSLHRNDGLILAAFILPGSDLNDARAQQFGGLRGIARDGTSEA
jgi:hypothetical protein